MRTTRKRSETTTDRQFSGHKKYAVKKEVPSSNDVRSQSIYEFENCDAVYFAIRDILQTVIQMHIRRALHTHTHTYVHRRTTAETHIKPVLYNYYIKSYMPIKALEVAPCAYLERTTE